MNLIASLALAFLAASGSARLAVAENGGAPLLLEDVACLCQACVSVTNGITKYCQLPFAGDSCADAFRHHLRVPLGYRCGMLSHSMSWGFYYYDAGDGAIERPCLLQGCGPDLSAYP